MNDYLSKDAQKQLLRRYRAHDFKRFHSMNAATKQVNNKTYFASYDTVCFRFDANEKMLYVYPYIYDTSTYCQSRTTTKQCNKWLRERLDICSINVQALRDLYVKENMPFAAYFKGIGIVFTNSQLYVSDFEIVRWAYV